MATVFETRGTTLLLRVRLTPRADRDAIAGTVVQADGSAMLGGRVRAVPEKGRANTALVSVLARDLNVPRRFITVVSGHTARNKTVEIQAADRELERALSARAATPTGKGEQG